MSEKREAGHKFIKPLLECESEQTRELKPFKETVEEFIDGKIIQKHMAESVSVYFRQLNDGQWFTIGDTEKFTPASLRKVPLMIAVFKHAEADPGFLANRIKFDLMRDHNEYQDFKPSLVLERNKEYTIEELVYRMVVYSDNNALMLLTRTIDPRETQDVYCMLNMPTCAKAPGDTEEEFLSVFTYASFFRILFNASFLNREFSEKALQYLASAEFTKGIVAGVPQDIAVAHKFGEYRDVASGKKQLHDCGIVYYPQTPYLICMMSRGDDFDSLRAALSSLSGLVYSEVDRQHQENPWP